MFCISYIPHQGIFYCPKCYSEIVMASIYFMRHAESASNLSPHLLGGRQNSVGLTELGEQQAVERGRAMKRQLIRPNIVAVSPAVRARETARLALGAMDYRGAVHIDPDLQEVSQGKFEGLPRDEVWTPERLAEIAEQGKEYALPGGESVAQVGERMYRAARKLDALAQQPEYARSYSHMYLPPHALAVTHETAIKALIAHIEGYDQKWVYRTRLANTSLTLITFTERSEHVNYMGLTY